MRERPILFSAPMVQAILDGRKTQTRRIGKTQCAEWTELAVEYSLHAKKGKVAVATHLAYPNGSARHGICECPYGIPGDRLWVRETFGHFERNENFAPGCEVFYRADGESLAVEPWRPSIHMPRWASRITLGITSIRAERVMDISEADAIAEGCRPFFDKRQPYIDNNLTFDPIAGPQKAFEYLWDSIYTKRHDGKYVWAANPWVWVVEFKVMKNG